MDVSVAQESARKERRADEQVLRDLRYHEQLEAEQRDLWEANQREGGFLSADPRAARLLDVSEQLDEIEARLLLDALA